MAATSEPWYRLVDRTLGEFFPAPFREFLKKWVPLSLLVGLAAGLATVAFQYSLDAVRFLFDPERVPWYLVFTFPTLGGLLVGMIIPRFAKETAGQGMDEVIRAVHFEGGRIRSVVPPVKILVSALTIGSGGSAGPEGPVGEIGAGTASILGRWLKLNRSDLRTLVLVGAAAGFSAVFKAPLGGALFALEIPYKNDMEHGAAIPALISSTTAYLLFVLFFGPQPIFGFLPASPPYGLGDLALYLALGLLAGMAAVLFVRFFSWASDAFATVKWPFVAKTTVGGLACGAIGVFFPAVLGLGYAWDVALVQGTALATGLGGAVLFAGWLLLVALPLLVLAKIVATSLTIGSGGSGGVLAPSVFIGGTLGAFLVAVLDGLGLAYPAPAVLVVVGMGAVLAAATKTPIASAVMLTEMTGGYGVLIPLILATVMSYSIAGEHTLYKAQITRKSLPIDLASLGRLAVRDAMTRPVETLTPDMKVEEAAAKVAAHSHYLYPVVDESGRVLGVVYRRSLLAARSQGTAGTVSDLLQTHFERINDDAPAIEAFEVMNGLQVTRMLVVDDRERLVGILTRFDLLRAMERSDHSV